MNWKDGRVVSWEGGKRGGSFELERWERGGERKVARAERWEGGEVAS